jgi:RND family efflux transporter MFP subunit
VTIADMGTLQVEADVSESSLELVKQGQHCEIQLDAIAEKRFRGVVHMIVPTADRSKATVMVKVRFVDKDIRILPEMSAKVAFLSRPIKEGEDKSRLALNPSAIINKNAKHYVFLVKANRAAETEIVPGQRMGDMVEVLNGVKAGDRIVVKPIDQVKNGGRIKIAEK